MSGRCRGGCDTLAGLGLWRERDCCRSCHMDEDDGLDALMDLHLPNDDWMRVCCRVKLSQGLDGEMVLARLGERGW